MAQEDVEAGLVDLVAAFQHDPLGYVEIAFAWGEGELVGQDGPRVWQRELLAHLGAKLKAGADPSAAILEAIQVAIASGHGIGKSAVVAWVILWALSTLEDTKVVVTANTAAQLATKTWPELAKWHRLAINAHWFHYTATALYSVDPKHEKTWRADAIPWSEHNTEAFAGLHNKGRRIVLIFDEASAIADPVWEVAEGALTDEGTEILWLAFGNPTRNAGRFRECFGRFAHRWTHRQIDSRTVEGTNKAQLEKWVADYGEDSDFVRVRVRGMFPNAGSLQFIPSDVIAKAAARRETDDEAPFSVPADPVVVGVDVARFGSDETVIQVRRSRDARTIPTLHLRGLDTMQVSARVAAECERLAAMGWDPDAVFIDETGVGAGVVDRCRQLLGARRVFGVNNGAKPDTATVDGENVGNKGTECWAKMRSWLRTGGAIADDPDLRAQLEGREYGYNVHNQLLLERKDDMRKRGLSSPDRADALALTFAYPVSRRGQHTREAGSAISDYDPWKG